MRGVIRRRAWMSLMGDLPPAGRLTEQQLRRNFGLAITLRWASAALVAVTGLIAGPRPFAPLALLIIAVAVYNSVLAIAIRHANERAARRLARLTWVLDQFFAFSAVAIFSGQPNGASPYLFVTLEAVMYEGLFGGLVSVGLFVVMEAGFQFGRLALFGVPVATVEAITFISVVGLAAAAFIGVTNILLDTGIVASLNGSSHNGHDRESVRLSPRELEIIQLIASGYSNGMIATRLHLSESTVKSYVETLLGRFNARNRTEAVAAASRLKLL